MCSQKPRDTIRQKQLLLSSVTFSSGRGQLKCDDTRAENRFRLSAKRTSPFKSAGGGQFSRLLAAEVCPSVVVMLDMPCSEAVWRVLATHSIRQFPPSLPFPCVTLCHHISTGLYYCHWDTAVYRIILLSHTKHACVGAARDTASRKEAHCKTQQ